MLHCTQYKSTYQEENDTFKDVYILAPCALLGLVLHPNVTGTWLVNVLWAFSTYLEVGRPFPRPVPQTLTTSYPRAQVRR
jgi:ER lumen protein retaining receptor